MSALSIFRFHVFWVRKLKLISDKQFINTSTVNFNLLARTGEEGWIEEARQLFKFLGKVASEWHYKIKWKNFGKRLLCYVYMAKKIISSRSHYYD